MIYIAKANDTWDLIAYKFYGDEFKSTDLMKANPTLNEIIMFKGGEKLNIPDNVETTSNNTLAPWRR